VAGSVRVSMIDRAVGPPETWKVPAYVTATTRSNISLDSRATFRKATAFAAIDAAVTQHG
jgi:hypothetical protein